VGLRAERMVGRKEGARAAKKSLKIKEGLLAGVIFLSTLLIGCGCANTSEENLGSDNAIKVSSVCELLDAIKPGADIVIAGGTYNITQDVLDIIKEANSDYDSLDASYEYIHFDKDMDDIFVISGVDSLTLTAEEGCYVELCIYNYDFTAALSFIDCSNIKISGITINAMYSQGAVGIRLDGCEEVNIADVNFENMPHNAVQIMNSTEIELVECEINKCALARSEVIACTDSDMTVRDCSFNENDNHQMFSATNSTISVFDSSITESGIISRLYEGDTGSAISFTGCTFGPLESRAFNYGYIYDFEDVSYENCEFDYTYGIHGANLIDEYYVHSEAEFCQNLGSRRILYLRAGTYNLTDFLSDQLNWQNYVVYGGNNERDKIKLEGEEGAYTLSLYDMYGLTIIGEVSDSGERLVEIVDDGESNYILEFNGCQNITVANIVLRHTENITDDSRDINWVNCEKVVTECIAGDSVYSEDGSAKDILEDIPQYLVVADAEEFIEVLRPGVAIKLPEKGIDFYSVIENSYGGDIDIFNESHEYFKYERNGDGYQPILSDLKDVYIGGRTDRTYINRMSESVSALIIRNCSGVELDEIHFNGYGDEYGLNCDSAVLVIEDSKDIFAYELEIRAPGNGAGVYCVDSDRVTLRDCKMSESYGDYAFYFENGSNIRLKDCCFVVIQSAAIFEMNEVEAVVEGCDFLNTTGYATNYDKIIERVINENSDNAVVFDTCDFGEIESLLLNFGEVAAGAGYTITDSCSFLE